MTQFLGGEFLTNSVTIGKIGIGFILVTLVMFSIVPMIANAARSRGPIGRTTTRRAPPYARGFWYESGRGYPYSYRDYIIYQNGGSHMYPPSPFYERYKDFCVTCDDDITP